MRYVGSFERGKIKDEGTHKERHPERNGTSKFPLPCFQVPELCTSEHNSLWQRVNKRHTPQMSDAYLRIQLCGYSTWTLVKWERKSRRVKWAPRERSQVIVSSSKRWTDGNACVAPHWFMATSKSLMNTIYLFLLLDSAVFTIYMPTLMVRTNSDWKEYVLQVNSLGSRARLGSNPPAID